MRKKQYPYPFLSGAEHDDFPTSSFTIDKLGFKPTDVKNEETGEREPGHVFTLTLRLNCASLCKLVQRGDALLRLRWHSRTTMTRVVVPVLPKGIPDNVGGLEFTVTVPVRNTLIYGQITFEAFIIAKNNNPFYMPEDADESLFGKTFFNVRAGFVLAKTNELAVDFGDEPNSSEDIISINPVPDSEATETISVNYADDASIKVFLRARELECIKMLRDKGFSQTVRAEICLPVLARALGLLAPNEGEDSDENKFRETLWGQRLLEALECENRELSPDTDFTATANALLNDVCSGALHELCDRFSFDSGGNDDDEPDNDAKNKGL